MDWLNVSLVKGLEVYCNDTCRFVLIKILLQAIYQENRIPLSYIRNYVPGKSIAT